MKELIQAFDEEGGLVHAWWNTGWNLLLSSDLLSREWHPERSRTPGPRGDDLTWVVHGPRLLLRACAVECLLKSLVVANGGVLAAGGQYRKPGGRAHDLVALAAAANLPLDQSEELLLKQLSLWNERGRYPIPFSWQRDLLQTARGPMLGNCWDDDDDEKAFAAFRERLHKLGVALQAKELAARGQAGS